MNDPGQILQAMRELLEIVRCEAPEFFQEVAIPPLRSYRGDQLERFWNSQADLLIQGRLYWGALIQANGNLMLPGDFHLPGEVVCSPDPIYDAQPDLLEAVASRIYALKGTEPVDPELQVVADHITDELYRAFCERIPTQLTEGRVVVRYTVIFYREHLPFRMLGPSRLMPILVHGRHDVAMILPGKLWLPDLVADWQPNAELLDFFERRQAADRAERRAGPVVRVTPAAIEAIRGYVASRSQPSFVYVTFEEDDKRMLIVERQAPGDVEATIEGLRFLVDAATAEKYWGLTIDFVQDDKHAGFVFNE